MSRKSISSRQGKATRHGSRGKAGSRPRGRSILQNYPKKDLAYLVAQARAPLEKALSKHSTDSSTETLTVFFSFSDGLRRATVVHFSGQDIDEVWKRLADWRQRGRKTPARARWLRIDWVTRRRTVSWEACLDELQQVKRNYFRYGIALDEDFRHAFLEQEINANAMLYLGPGHPKAGLNRKNFTRYGVNRYGSAFELPASPQSRVVLFTTQAILVEPDQPPVPLYGYVGGKEGRNTGRRMISKLDPTQVRSLIEQSSRFLADQVDASGRFTYGTHPCFDREIKSYNTLRHASTTYSMLEAWEITRDSKLKSKIDLSLQHLVERFIRRYALPSGQSVCYLQDNNKEIKLGGNAVCLLALVKYTELTGDQKYSELMTQIAGGIELMQDPESGRFTHVLNADDLSVKEEFRIIYYDGEAAFGLMRLYGLTRDERWLGIVEKAFEHFIDKEHWRSHDHWLSYCVNELTIYRPEERYYQFGIRNFVDHLDFVIGRITTFPTLLELMMAAHKMLKRLETSRRHGHLLSQVDRNKFHRALEARAHYLLNGFFWPEFAIFFQNPQRVLGSFFIRHHSFRVRIDDVEHYLSGFVAYLRHYLSPEPDEPPDQDTASGQDEQLAQGWNREHVQSAADGEWLSMPDDHWHATGLSITPTSFQEGHMVAVKGASQAGGIPVGHLARLSMPPSAIISETGDSARLIKGVPIYQVPSVREAILQFGRHARKQFTGKVIGITGSAGKTSTVKLVQEILGHWGKAEASRLSANMVHGIAWNLASMDWRSAFHVVEMAIGRMPANSALARPDVALFLNVGPAHLEFHHTTEQIAIKKSRIFDAMRPGAHAVINRDMQEWHVVKAAAERKELNLLTFGTHPESDIRWLNPSPLVPPDGAVVQLHQRQLVLPVAGRGDHFVMNLLSAFGAMLALELPCEEVIDSLQDLLPAEGRGNEWQLAYGDGKVTFLDDAYNANPLSMKAMLEQVAMRECEGNKHLLLADMLELGENSSHYHHQLIPNLCRSGADSVTLLGSEMHDIATQLESCLPDVFRANDHDEAGKRITGLLQPGDLLVAKGSNKFKLSLLLKKISNALERA